MALRPRALGRLRAILLGILLFPQAVVAIGVMSRHQLQEPGRHHQLQEPALEPEEAVESALELTVVDRVHGEAHMSTEQQMQLAE